MPPRDEIEIGRIVVAFDVIGGLPRVEESRRADEIQRRGGVGRLRILEAGEILAIEAFDRLSEEILEEALSRDGRIVIHRA